MVCLILFNAFKKERLRDRVKIQNDTKKFPHYWFKKLKRSKVEFKRKIKLCLDISRWNYRRPKTKAIQPEGLQRRNSDCWLQQHQSHMPGGSNGVPGDPCSAAQLNPHSRWLKSCSCGRSCWKVLESSGLRPFHLFLLSHSFALSASGFCHDMLLTRGPGQQGHSWTKTAKTSFLWNYLIFHKSIKNDKCFIILP